MTYRCVSLWTVPSCRVRCLGMSHPEFDPGDPSPDQRSVSIDVDSVAGPTSAARRVYGRVYNRVYGTVVVADATSDVRLDRLRHPRAVSMMERIAHIGDGGAVWLLLLALFGRTSPRAALRAAGALAVGSIVVNGPVKRLSSRPRPVPLPGDGFRPRGSSFPSGHSFSSWMMVVLLPPVRGLRLLAVPVAVLISASRVFLRYHHVSDVIAGSLLGVSVGWLLRRFVRWR